MHTISELSQLKTFTLILCYVMVVVFIMALSYKQVLVCGKNHPLHLMVCYKDIMVINAIPGAFTFAKKKYAGNV